MDEDENYDIMPHKEIMRIKKELEQLKNVKETTETKNILHQINQLKNSINDLLDIFKEAQESFKLEEKEPAYIKTLVDKLDTLSHQNTRIAEGIVAVADIVKETRLKVEKTIIEKPEALKSKPAPIPPPPFGAPPTPPPIQMPPPQNIPPPPAFDIPPPPDFTEPKKKGLFGRRRK